MAQNADLLQGQQPLQGVVLCCTSIPQDVRTQLAEIATQMGAVNKLDLTSDVTHLIVGSIATPKYQYVAKERPDIKVLHPAWLEDARNLWMEGADLDIIALERKHQCPPFFGLHICVTGFEDLEQRTYISSTVTEQGATYHADLTKAVTHLIAAAPRGQKYTHAKRWNITVVSLKWFEDSLERGMALDETFYDPTFPLEEQGKGAFKRHRTSLGKRGRDAYASKTGNLDLARKRLRRTASSRLESQSQDMWQDMSTEPLKTEDLDQDSWMDDRSHSSTATLMTTSHRNSDATLSAAKAVSKEAALTNDTTDGLFSGYHILTHGFEQRRTSHLDLVLSQNGATIAHTTAELEDASQKPFFKERCLLVPHAVSGKAFDLPKVPSTALVVTEWWVERCIHYKQLLDPIMDALSRPIWNAEVAGFEELLISTTGFSGLDVRQVAQTVKLMGATYQERVLPTSSVIVSGSAEIKKEKAFYARKHRIPVVSLDWLWACLKARKNIPFDKYIMSLPAFHTKGFGGGHDTGSPEPSDAQQPTADTSNRRDDRMEGSKRLSSSRKRHAPASLPLHATMVETTTTTSRAKAIVHEVETQSVREAYPPTMLAVKHSETHPLREVSPNLSPGNGDTETTQRPGVEGHESVPAKPSSSLVPPSKALPGCISPPQGADLNFQDTPPLAPRTHHELTADLADLLNKTVASRPSSEGPGHLPLRRKDRPLGRASSGTSHRSLSAADSVPSQSLAFLAAEDERSGMDIDAGSDALPPSSTQLGYENPETQLHRMHMSKKMGTKLHDDSDWRRVPSLGVVKDTSLMADAGVGNRVKGRGRAK